MSTKQIVRGGSCVTKRMLLFFLISLNTTMLFAQANPVFNEILYNPAGVDANNQKIEIKNIGTATADISGWYFCIGFVYTELPAGISIPPGGIIVIHVGASGDNTSTEFFLSGLSDLNVSAGNIGLYINNSSFTTSSNMWAYVQWGGSSIGRESVADDAGLWTPDTFAPGVTDGHSIEYDGMGNSSSDWTDQSMPTIGLENGIVTTVGIEKVLPSEYDLAQNYPNPFNPVTTIAYQLPQSGRVSLIIYDLLGAEVATLINSVQSSGIHSVRWNATNVASGIYFYRLRSGSFTQTRKLVVIK